MIHAAALQRGPLDAASPMATRCPNGAKEGKKRPKPKNADDDDEAFCSSPATIAIPQQGSRLSPPLSNSGHEDQSVQQLLATSPRAGGLLDAMRARGTLSQAVVGGPKPLGTTLVVSSLASADGAPSIVASVVPVSPRVGPRIVKAPVKEKRRPGPKKKAMPPVPAFQAQPEEPEPWEILRKTVLPPKNPDDDYEISDKEDSADELEEPDRSDKHVPAWSLDYSVKLTAQENVDPDTIFGSKVPICDLDMIFPDALYREWGCAPPRRKRGSSCLWHKDRLSRSEIVAYRRKMGHQRRWSVLTKTIKQKLMSSASPGKKELQP